VALKRPLPDMAEDPKFVTMFLEEARIAARLQHENIAAIYEVDKHHDHYYLTMEYVDGPSVRSLMRNCAKSLVAVPISVALTITADLLRALAHVHAYTGPDGQQLALIHRDVNPNNILLRTDGKGKLVDFGIARAGDRLMRTQTGHVRGTIPYMSPEQARGAADIDQRTDVYSAGVVCYEMLTALRAFPNGPHRDRPKSLCQARPDAPRELETVVARAMAFLREERQMTAGEFLDDLRNATDAATVSDYRAVAELIARMTPASGEEAPQPSLQTLDETGTFSS
jgi:serine/threonine protein kinase